MRAEYPLRLLAPLNFDWRTQVALRLLVPLLLSVPLIPWRNDFAFGELLWRWQAEHWSITNAFLTETVMHQVGRALSQLGFVFLLFIAWWSIRRGALKHWIAPLRHLVVPVLFSTLVVSVTKKTRVNDCPYDMTALGGKKPSLSVFTARPPRVADGPCFPASHANAGFSEIALYVAAAAVGWSGRRQRALLVAALLTGTALGFAQQFRGAHFVSHDLWTVAICWFVTLAFTPMLKRSTQ